MTSSAANSPNLAPISRAMLATVSRLDMSVSVTADPVNSIARYCAPSAPKRPVRCRITSFQETPVVSSPVISKRMVSGTRNQRFPVASA